MADRQQYRMALYVPVMTRPPKGRKGQKVMPWAWWQAIGSTRSEAKRNWEAQGWVWAQSFKDGWRIKSVVVEFTPEDWRERP